jgi:hypothetical protein
VNRWISRIHDELCSEEGEVSAEGVASAESGNGEMVVLHLEFGRACLDATACPLQVGGSLPLEALAEQPIDLVADGQPVARGELVVMDGRLGVRIVELLLAVIACLWFAPAIAQADDGSQISSPTFESSEPAYFESPFGVVRGHRLRESNDAVSANSRDELGDVNSTRLARSRALAKDVSIETPLSPRSTNAIRESGISGSAPSKSDSRWLTSGWGLLIVFGLVGLGARWLKGRSSTALCGLPKEAFEILARKAIDSRTSVLVARCGSRLLLLSHSPQGLRTLAEIVDPVEVDCLAGLCRATHRDQTLVDTFRSLLRKPAPRSTSSSTTKSPLPDSFNERLFGTRTAPVPTLTDQERLP